MSTVAHNLDSIKVRSNDVILKENVSFADMKLKSESLFGLEAAGFRRPSPVQYENIPLGRCGLDLIVQSKAGTGKTCIFAITALETLEFKHNSPIQCIIVVPTREIASQIYDVITAIGVGYKDLRCLLCIGGTELKNDRKNLSPNADNYPQIIIGTPGRLKQLIELNLIKTSHVELFVLDEADKLIEDQFKIQIDEIYKRLPADKQMIATSATYPDELAEFLRQYMQTPQYIKPILNPSLDAIKEYYLECKPGHSTKKTIEKKLDALTKLLSSRTFDQCIIFTNYQARAPMICRYLNNNGELIDKTGTVSYICAELPQKERENIFNKFRKSRCKILVSTDISARGIDIEGIDLVINLDVPVDKSTYYHRVGRAGRFGSPGVAITVLALESVDLGLFEKNLKDCKLAKLNLV